MEAKPATQDPMPHFHIQKAALAGLEIEWKNDLWGCRPTVVPRSKRRKQVADLGRYAADQTPTPNTAANLKRTDDTMNLMVGKKEGGMHTASAGTARASLLSAHSELGSISTKGARKFVDLKNERLLLRGGGLELNVTSKIAAGGGEDTPSQGRMQSATSREVHAVGFPEFRKLPSEVKIMIWDNALPNFVEVVVNEDTKRFYAPGPREAILDLCHDFVDMFHMQPIQFSCENVERFNLDVVYIRPQVDTIYIGCQAMIHLDIHAFCAHPNNQFIENLALSAVSCGNLRWCGIEYGRQLGTRSLVGDLVRGLKNLKKIYVVEGDRLHKESEIEYWSDGKLLGYTINLGDVPETTNLSRYDHRGRHFFWPPAKPWVHALALDVIQMYKEEIEREKSGEYEIVFTGGWSQPEMIPKLLSRTLFVKNRQTPRPKAPTRLQFLPRPLPATQFFRNPIRLSSYHDFESERLSLALDASTDSPDKTTSFSNRTTFLE